MTEKEYVKELKELYKLAKKGLIPYSPMELLDKIREAEKDTEQMKT